ncbi:hypothetical protein J4233_01050 [Candidatus Pacearchaeota archaeon]|nr:hypothetical protein [uncultured archaeon]AQS28861.1 hypothetical protein [uncultured archaeon]AQS29049.1 hypothetical protein [uncultured archaeon]MBS3076837.1 hypothetical protein [Candidatus Pacearchaeota archaeon]
MSWLDKLKALFNIEVNSPLININVTRNSDNSLRGKGYSIDEEKQRLYVNYDGLPEEKKKKLAEIFRDRVESGGEVFEDKTYILLKDLYDYQKNKGEDKKVLDFFAPLIPKDDYEALEASLYLRKKFSERLDVRKLKEDIRRRFGDRGNNISNLCTAGYFEKFLIQLYNYSREDFKEIYEVIVSKSAMAVFVSSQMSDYEITQDLRRKIDLSKKYGLDFVHIHGIGERNILTVRRWIEENKGSLDFLNKEIFEKEGIIIVELLL